MTFSSRGRQNIAHTSRYFCQLTPQHRLSDKRVPSPHSHTKKVTGHEQVRTGDRLKKSASPMSQHATRPFTRSLKPDHDLRPGPLSEDHQKYTRFPHILFGPLSGGPVSTQTASGSVRRGEQDGGYHFVSERSSSGQGNPRQRDVMTANWSEPRGRRGHELRTQKSYDEGGFKDITTTRELHATGPSAEGVRGVDPLLRNFKKS